MPPGVLNIVTASRERAAEVVDVWLDDPRVRKISFTGSTPVGKHLARRSADTLKKLSLELGGNAPFIVFDDADLDAAVEGLMAAKFRNGGQTCVCPNRVFVQAGVHDAFVDKLAARVAALKVGPASDAGSQIGPMINARAVDKIERHVRDAVERGARVVVGGTAAARQLGRNYFAPTRADRRRRDDGLRLRGDLRPGRAGDALRDRGRGGRRRQRHAVTAWPRTSTRSDVRRIWRVAEALEAGLVGINEGALAAEAAPFGGVKESGYGREGSVHGLDDYMHLKYLCQGQL